MSWDTRGGLLAPTRVDEILIEDYPLADEYSEGVGTMRIKTHVHEHANGKEVVVKKEVDVLNQAKTLIRSELEYWDYNSVHSPPLEHLKEIRARLWLPGRGRRSGLNLVERQRTVFWWETIFAQQTGEISYRTERQGEVVYRMAPLARTLTADQETAIEDQGRESGGPIRIILDSAMTWDQCVSRSAIVEKEDQPATSIWRTIEVTEHRVEETWALVQSYTITKNYLNPGDVTVDGPHYTKKAGVVFRLPVPLEPPEITDAVALSGQVRVIAEGGGAVFRPSWPDDTAIPIRPQKYRLYRRVVTMPSRSLNDDPTGIWDTAPTAAERFSPGVGETAVTDTAGAPSTSLPSAGADAEPESPDAPDTEYWEMIGEVDNEVADKHAPGRGSVLDTDVESGATYEYRATVVVGEDESEPSRAEQVAYTGATSPGGMRITTGKDGDKAFADVVAPADVEADELLGDFGDEYGETLVFEDLPVELSDDFTIEDLGRDIGQAQMIRNQGLRECKLIPTIPFLNLQRGQLISVPQLAWKTMGAGLVIDSATAATKLRVDGFGMRFSAADDGGFDLTIDPIECLEVSL